MKHIHFAWELGGGLGHAGRLKLLAEEAARRGHQVTMSLRDLVHTNNVLRDVAVPRFQAPVWLHQVHGVPSPPVSLAEILLTCGYLNSNALMGLFVGWRSLLGTLKPDLVVADFAPTAVLAARSLGIHSAAIGIGFSLPPDVSPLPSLREWEAVALGRIEAADRQMLSSINSVLQSTDTAPLQRAAQALQGDSPLLLTWPELDHYGRDTLPFGQQWWGPSMLPQAGSAPVWPGVGSGPKVFAYLKTEHPDHVAVLQALVKKGCRTLCYLPSVASGKPAPVVSPLIQYASGPVDLAATLIDCQLCICHAGEGTIAPALLAGVPVLLMPSQTEQYLISRRVAATGAGLNAAQLRRPTNYAAAIASMLDSSGYRDAAQAFAARYSGFTVSGQTNAMTNEFERLMA
jgi:UDP:flavonoid glycosyltransferase YjiC (YdhE family)